MADTSGTKASPPSHGNQKWPFVWKVQLMMCLMSPLIFGGYLFWNYHFRNIEKQICNRPGLTADQRRYFLLLTGGSLCRSIGQIVRFLVRFRTSSSGWRHPYAALMSVLVHFIAGTMNIGVILSNHITCEDRYGVRISPFFLMEWLCTTPFLLFILLLVDVKRTTMTITDASIMVMGGLCILSFSLSFEQLETMTPVFQFLSNLFMVLATSLLLHESREEYIAATREMTKIPRDEWETANNRISYDRLKISQWKLNGALMTMLMSLCFPTVYFLHSKGTIDFVTFTCVIHTCGLLAMEMHNLIICDDYLEIMDANKILFVEEKKRNAAAKQALLRYVFHEVRVPLNSISLGIDYLQENDARSTEEADTLSLMNGSSKLMSEILNDMLLLQKIEDGRLELDKKLFPPQVLVASVLSSYRSQFESKDLTIYVDIQPEVPLQLYGDQFKLEHTLGNFLSNAIKFSDVSTRIWISVAKEKDHVIFSVKDEGPGMTESLCQSMFHLLLYEQGQNDERFGLGLFICKSIIALSDGHIYCRSNPRQDGDISTGYAEFSFAIKDDGDKQIDQQNVAALTMVKSKEDQSIITDSNGDSHVIALPPVLDSLNINRSKKEQAYKVCISPSLKSDVSEKLSNLITDSISKSFDRRENTDVLPYAPHILVVDDVSSNRRMLKFILHRHGLECDEAKNGQEALSMVKSKGNDYYQIIFMDSYMPVMDGLTATAALRKEGFRDLIIGATGNTSDEDIAQFEDTGADVVIPKPLSMQSIDKILNYCNQQRERIEGMKV